jgi:hypothetical protein
MLQRVRAKARPDVPASPRARRPLDDRDERDAWLERFLVAWRSLDQDIAAAKGANARSRGLHRGPGPDRHGAQ